MTLDHLLYHGDSFASSLERYKKDKTGPLSVFPFGAFAYARIDDRLQKYQEWSNAPRKPGRDQMALKPNQPQLEFWNLGMRIIPSYLNLILIRRNSQKHTAARYTMMISLSMAVTSSVL
jgi:hypothetical protein